MKSIIYIKENARIHKGAHKNKCGFMKITYYRSHQLSLIRTSAGSHPSHLRIDPAPVILYHDICLPFMDHNQENNYVV